MDRACSATCGAPELCDEALSVYEAAIADGGLLPLDEVPMCLRGLGLVSPSAGTVTGAPDTLNDAVPA